MLIGNKLTMPRSFYRYEPTLAEAKMKDIEAKIGPLTALKYALSTLVAECSGERPLSDCPILESLETREVRR